MTSYSLRKRKKLYNSETVFEFGLRKIKLLDLKFYLMKSVHMEIVNTICICLM